MSQGDTVTLNVELTREGRSLLERVAQHRYPGRRKVLGLTVEQLIREEAQRIEAEERRRGKGGGGSSDERA